MMGFENSSGPPTVVQLLVNDCIAQFFSRNKRARTKLCPALELRYAMTDEWTVLRFMSESQIVEIFFDNGFNRTITRLGSTACHMAQVCRPPTRFIFVALTFESCGL